MKKVYYSLISTASLLIGCIIIGTSIDSLELNMMVAMILLITGGFFMALNLSDD